MSVCSSTFSGSEDMEELESVGWYHYDLSRHATETLLLSNGVDGSFLLRNRRKGPDSFALSVRAKDSVKHFHVQRHNGKYSFGFNEFSSLQDFATHLANQPLLGSETGNLIVLRFPYPRQVEEPSIYESVCVHTAIQSGRNESDLVPSAPSLGTKEGYLIKQGGIIKNWKQRWFILNRNELKYFKDKMFSEPIRALDLTACSAVQFDYSQDRVNCFCLVFPERTFYLCAKSGVEADEWIKILRWKLVSDEKEHNYIRQPAQQAYEVCSGQYLDGIVVNPHRGHGRQEDLLLTSWCQIPQDTICFVYVRTFCYTPHIEMMHYSDQGLKCLKCIAKD